MAEPKQPMDWYPQFDAADNLPHPVVEAHKQTFQRLYALRDFLNMAQSSNKSKMDAIESTAATNLSSLQSQLNTISARITAIEADIVAIKDFVGM